VFHCQGETGKHLRTFRLQQYFASVSPFFVKKLNELDPAPFDADDSSRAHQSDTLVNDIITLVSRPILTWRCGELELKTKKEAVWPTASRCKQEYCELVNVKAVLEGNGRRNRNTVNLFRLKLDLSSGSDRLFGQAIRQTIDRCDGAYRTIGHQRDLERNAALDVVCTGLICVCGFRLE
jgi:hypothetical protein